MADELPEGFISIDDMIKDLEQTVPNFKEHMRIARIKLAPILYPNGGPQYDRLMRGEPPPSGDCR